MYENLWSIKYILLIYIFKTHTKIILILLLKKYKRKPSSQHGWKIIILIPTKAHLLSRQEQYQNEQIKKTYCMFACEYMWIHVEFQFMH